LLFQAFLALPYIGAGLSLLGFNRLYVRLYRQQRAAVHHAEPGEQRRAQALITARMVHRAARYHIRQFNCLPRSLALWWLLRRQGIIADLRIGTCRQGDRLEAHAWVEFEGSPLNDYADVYERFATFDQVIMPRS
jgi:hypothetical protein